MKKFSFKQKLVAGAAVVALAAGASAAYAAWTTTGGGSGTAHALSNVAVVVNPVTPTADLYPGGPAGVVSFTITNGNPYSVNITQLTAGTITTSDQVNCPAATYVTNTGPFTTAFVIAPGTSGTLSISGAVSLTHSAPDGCQGVTINVPLTVTGGTQV